MAQVESFDPVIGRNPKLLILGSMPGLQSLRQHQYYAHPRNAFWPVMSALYDIDWASDYQQRIVQLQALPLVLWDVLGQCDREGSLDSAIKPDSVRVNNIAAMLAGYPTIQLVAFNGATAARLYRRHVLEQWPNLSGIRQLQLPSTSPAHASMTLAQKIHCWKAILEQ